MKSVLSILLLVGVALGYSTSYYGWVPQKEFLYRFESQVLTGIPEIRSQYSGLKLTSVVRIQTFPDYSLRIKFEEPRFLTINEELPVIDGKIVAPLKAHEEVPEAIRVPLVTPFEVHLKRGVIEGLFVEKNEPVVVTNLKKALLAQLQMDLSASRESMVQKLNHVVLPQVQTAQEEMHNISFFSTMETSLHGDCETSYTLHPLPLYQARELEEQWRIHKIKVMKSLPMYASKIPMEKLMKESHEAELICQGKQYYQVTKTKNFDNCRQRPVFAAWAGVKGFCDTSKSQCEDLMTHLSTSRYVICGTPEQFYIRKVITENMISVNPIAWNTEEKMKFVSTVELELLKIETAGFKPLMKPIEPKKLKTLFLEYPLKKTLSPKSISDKLELDETRQEKQLRTLTGFYPLHPMPEMNIAPELLFPISIPKPEIYHQIKELMSRIVKETFETPESCSSSSDVAGYIMAIAKALRPLSLDELKETQVEIIRFMETRDMESLKVAKYLYYDILSMVGTNPSVVFIKELIEAEEIPREYAPQLLQSTLKNIKTPTHELMNMIFSLVKNVKSKSMPLYSVSAITFSDLIYRACINPTSMVVEFPVRIYGNFCNPETTFIKEQWIPYLETQLEGVSRKSSQEKVILLTSLGKLGHYKALIPLVKVIEGQISEKPLIRSLAVYNLKRIAREYPAKIRPVLLSLIDNPAENPEVRIAAVAVLPFTSPSTAELQKIALRTWFEPSKQVTSFIYSTFKSLLTTEVPELLNVRMSVKNILPLVKPVESGIQFSHNIYSSKFLEYLKLISVNGIKVVNTEESLIPNKLTFSTNIINRSFKIQGLELSMYSQGMDYVLEKLMYFSQLESEVSESVRAELQKIDEKLQIKKREILSPEVHLHLKFMGLERVLSFNSEFYYETMQKIIDELSADPKMFTEGMKFEYTKAQKLYDIQVIAPCDSGFPIYLEKSAPVIFSVKGMFKAQDKKIVETELVEPKIPSVLLSKIFPVMNVKIQNHMGVISPFTKQYIGAGVDISVHSALPLETKVSLNMDGQISISLKSPEEIQKEIEMLHLNVKPYTFKKSMETIEPASQSTGVKKILSGHLIKKVEVNPGHYLGLDIPVKISTDYPVFDYSTLIKKFMKAPNPMVALTTAFMPGSVRYASIQVRFNPTSSQTKELQARFTLAHAFKMTPSENLVIKFPKVLNHHEEEIKKMCVENHQSEFEVNKCLESQKKMLHSTADVSVEDRKYCEHLKYPSHTEEEFEQCLKAVKVCEQSKVICLKMQEPIKICEEKKIACQVRQHNLLKVKYILRKLQKGVATSFAVEGSINSHYEKKTTRVIISVGAKKQGLFIKSFAEIDYKTPLMEPFIVEAEVDSELPEIKTKWNKEQLLSDDIKYKSKVLIYYGYKSEPEKKKIFMETLFTKTESQKQSVRKSLEYQRCSQEEAEGRKLSPICEKIRHQAASVDKMVLKIQVPKSVAHCPVPKYIENIVKSYFLFQLKERSYESYAVSSLGKNELVIEALFSRQGEEAHLKVQRPGMEWEIEDIRLPYIFRNVLPMSVRNGVFYRLFQKSTYQQSPASCRIESQWVTTFDNKTYPYTLNDCEHLLVKDCSGIFPIAVTASGSSSQKHVKIVVGMNVIELKPETGSVLTGVFINGEKKMLRQGEVFVVKSHISSKPILEIQAYLDGVVVVREFQNMLEVAFDGEHIEVVAPQLIRSRACGICGDLNGEKLADLKTPKMCIFKKPRIAAYSYMIPEHCQGIPPQDKMEFEKEVHTCVKKHTLKTPLEDLTKRIVKVKSGPKGILMKHLVEYRANGNEICFTKKVVPVCEENSVPIIGQMSSTPFTCMQVYTQHAKHLKMRVEANEEIPELRLYPTTYNRMIEEVSGCKVPTEATKSHFSSSITPHSYKTSSGRYQPEIYDY